MKTSAMCLIRARFFGVLALLTALSLSTSAQTLVDQKFRLASESEVILTLKASAPGTSWAMPGAEAAVLTVETDSRYKQDIILFAGAETFTYRALLGRLSAGEHSLRITHNKTQSAPQAAKVVIAETTIAGSVGGNKLEELALAHAPMLYARPDTVGKFSDIPLLMWYEVIREGATRTIRYSIIFTNEDGGTQTAALMARWGRVTDIEWLNEVRLDEQDHVLSEVFQGTSHRTLPFTGRYEAGHPVYIDASRNNNFSDQIPEPTALRFAPVPVAFDTARQSREELMDQNPWTYRLMFEEMQREGRIAATDAEVAGAAGLGMKIIDPRRYLYFDGESTQTNAALSFAVKLKGDPRWYASDLGHSYFRIDRSGWFRSTVRLPPLHGAEQIEQIAVKCDALPETQTRRQDFRPEPTCAISTIRKAFLLDQSFHPGATLPLASGPWQLRFGEMAEIYRCPGCETRAKRP
jgi:hypothetical protein